MTPAARSLSPSRQVCDSHKIERKRGKERKKKKTKASSSHHPSRYTHNTRDSACFAFADYKCTLMQLPPAAALRDGLLAKLTAALDAQPETLTSIARIGNATQIQNAPLTPRLARTHTHRPFQ